MIRSVLLIGVSFFALMSCGCLLNHSHHTVIRQGEPLYPIAFETDAARTCFEEYVEQARTSSANESHSSLSIPFLLGLQRSKSVSESAIRNDAAVRFDANADGTISDYEANVFGRR